MDDEIDRMTVAVRADTGAFARDVADLRAQLADGLGQGADRAGRSIETALARAVGRGKVDFDDLRATALRALEGIAAGALKGGIASLFGGGGDAGRSGGLVKIASSLIGAAFGLPGRATGGPVSPGAAYVVGERGPELFVPTSSGSVAPAMRGGPRDVRVAISINAGGGDAPAALSRSSRQVARAVARALDGAEG